MSDRTRVSRRTVLQLAAAAAAAGVPVYTAAPAGAAGGWSADRFARPGTGSMPMVLWFWNGTVTRELVDDGLADLRAQGVTEVLVFPFDTAALRPEFFTEEWFDLIGHTLREAERHDMAIWLFNDDFFPSGRAGGFVVHGGTVGDRTYPPRPDLRAKCVLRSTFPVAGGTTAELTGRALSVADGRLLVDAAAYDGVRVLKAGTGWTDYDVTARVRVDRATAGLMVRSPDAKNGYLADLRADGGVDLWLQRDGAFTRLRAGAAPPAFDAAADHELTVTVRGDTLTPALDGTELPGATDATFAAGTAGVRATATQRSSWDDLRVTAPDGAELFAAAFDSPADADAFATPGDLGTPVAAAARPAGASGDGTVAKMTDLTEAAVGPGVWEAPAGDWQVDVYSLRPLADASGPWRNYLDLLDDEAVELYMDIVPAEYLRRFGWAAGGVLRGFADDEPFLSSSPAAWGRVPWSPTLPAELETLKAGAGAGIVLSAVHDDLGAEGRALRGVFWRAVSNRFADAYYRRLGGWTAERGLDVISNPLWDEFGPARQLRSSGNLNTSHQHVQIPGTDLIFDHQELGFHRILPRWPASAAHQRGLERVYLEAMGGVGWQTTPAYTREVIGSFAVRGINKVLLHCRFSDSEAIVYPPPFQPVNPWWHVSAPLNTWIGRVVEATRATAPARTALLQPQRAAECYQDDEAERNAIDAAFTGAAHALEDVQVDFDFLDEGALTGDPALLEHGRPRDGRLAVGHAAYEVVVLPRTPMLSLAAVRTLTGFVGGGGTLVAVGDLPRHEPSGADDRLARALDRLFAHPGAHRADAPAAAAALVADSGAAAAKLTPAIPEVRVLRLTRDGDAAFFLANERDDAVEFTAVFPAHGAPELWDPESGETRPAGVWRRERAGTAVPLELGARATVLVVLRSGGREPAHAVEANAPVAELKVRGDTATATVRVATAMTVRVAAVDGPRRFSGSRRSADPLTPVPLDGDWSFRFDRDGAETVQRPLGSWTELDAAHSGSAVYGREFRLEETQLRGRRWLLDLGEVRDVAEVTVNDEELPGLLWAPYRVDVTDALRAGANELTVRITNTGANERGTAVESGLLGPVLLRPERLVEVRLARRD
ncbi:glycosylhydrolase-like jelly roll fold domain-containing protein [Streptomyces sp. NPDC004134]|uniref:glycosylhydrolase-like jelly roll fold domain-containing protein n=1 Tax=Streptomyces sp. NPDC004134 TaxID=3364691 RepID=UPI0036B6C53A